MKDAAPQTVHLSDYAPPAFLVEEVHLTFRLAPRATRVLSRIRFRPNPDAAGGAFFLHGEELRSSARRSTGRRSRPSSRPRA